MRLRPRKHLWGSNGLTTEFRHHRPIGPLGTEGSLNSGALERLYLWHGSARGVPMNEASATSLQVGLR